MTNPWIYHLLITLPIYLLMHLGLAGIFKKAGHAPWKALVPVLNVQVWLEIVGKPRWWLIWYLIPVINLVMGINLILDLLRSFRKHGFADHFFGVVFPFVYFLYLGFNKKDTYQGKWCMIHGKVTKALAERKDGTLPMEIEDEFLQYKAPKAKGQIREWADAFLFAGTAALIIRTLMLEAFMIPTTSMEGTLLAGDFLFVSKFHYGVRMPMVPVSIPFVHNTFPGSTKTKSYLPILQLPYSRLPGLRSVERNDIVVFNYPADDIMPDRDGPGKITEISMKQNYVKRCVGVGGDTLRMVDGQLWVNGKPGWTCSEAQFQYVAEGPMTLLTKTKLKKIGFRFQEDDPRNLNILEGPPHGNNAMFLFWASEGRAQKVRELGEGVVVNRSISAYDSSGTKWQTEGATLLYPNYLDPLNGNKPIIVYPEATHWTPDNFGPILIPKQGMTIHLDNHNIGMYQRCIEAYEGHKLEVNGSQILIDGQATDSYTFGMDYYWMMGDNRLQSLDSRFWGFVPETHIVGRPWFILFSYEKGPRWNRFFHGMGAWEPN